MTNDGIKNAEDPKLVVNVIMKLIHSEEPSFRNLVGKMSGIIVFLQNYAPKMFEKTMLKNVEKAK